MFYVYVLQSIDEDQVFYIGSTNDLKRRVAEHNRGENTSTKHRQWRLVYYEAYVSMVAARERERKLKKHGRAKQLLLERIKNSLEEDDS